MPAKETVDFLGVGVATALVAALPAGWERGRAPRLRRRGRRHSDCWRKLGVPTERLSTVSKAGIQARRRSGIPLPRLSIFSKSASPRFGFPLPHRWRERMKVRVPFLL